MGVKAAVAAAMAAASPISMAATISDSRGKAMALHTAQLPARISPNSTTTNFTTNLSMATDRVRVRAKATAATRRSKRLARSVRIPTASLTIMVAMDITSASRAGLPRITSRRCSPMSSSKSSARSASFKRRTQRRARRLT